MTDDVERFGVPPSECPKCSKVLETAFIPGDEEAVRPKRGDFTVCMFCYTVLAFTADGGGGLRLVTRAEIAKLSIEERYEIDKVRGVSQMLRERRRN